MAVLLSALLGLCVVHCSCPERSRAVQSKENWVGVHGSFGSAAWSKPDLVHDVVEDLKGSHPGIPECRERTVAMFCWIWSTVILRADLLQDVAQFSVEGPLYL